MVTFRMRYALLSLVCLLLVSCKKPDLVDEKTFINCYSQILIIKSSVSDSTVAAAQVQQVLDGAHITKEQMQEQLKLYADDPDRYRRVLAGINDRLRSLDSAARATAKP